MKKITTILIVAFCYLSWSPALLEAHSATTPSIIVSDSAPCGTCPIWDAYCKGRKSFDDGSTYTGEFRFGRPDGLGTLVWSDGSKYTGEFFNGLRHGTGSFTSPDGTYYEGQWNEGTMEGQGAYSWSCGHEYIGTFHQNKMHGEGALLMANGEVYSGFWKEGIAHGAGTFSRTDGSQFVGTFKDGEKDGVGTIIWPSGDTLRGNWAAGKMDGPVQYFFHNGDQLNSIWDDGELLEDFVYHTFDGLELEGQLQEVTDFENSLDFNILEDFLDNMQLGVYSFAMEYKNQNKYEAANTYLQLSMDYTPFPNAFSNTIALQLKELEKNQKQGWAKLE